jgi:hypothetical protein
MATVFWAAGGVIRVDFLEPGTTIISDRYIATLINLKQRLKRIQRKKEKVLLQYDNARPHASSATMEGTARLNLAILLHLPCSPDLASCDCHLCPKRVLKDYRREHQYALNEQVGRTLGNQLWKKSV